MRRWIIIVALAALSGLAVSAVADAHNCSSPADCEQTAGYNTVVAVAGGLMAIGAGLLGGSVGGTSGSQQPTPPSRGPAPPEPLPAEPLPAVRRREDLRDPDNNYEPLLVNDGSYEDGNPGDVFYDGDWMSPEEAAGHIRERERQRAEIDRAAAEHDAAGQRMVREQNEGLVERNEAEVAAERERNERIDEADRIGDGLIERLDDDPERQGLYEDFLSRHRDDPDAYERALDAIRRQTFEAEQQQQLGERDQALGEEQAYADSEEYAGDVRDWSMRANQALARIVPGGDRIVSLQSQLYGHTQNYADGGFQRVISRAGAGMVDQYTAGLGSAIHDTHDEGKGLGELADKWRRGHTDKFDPRVHKERLENAKSLGDIVDAGTELYDAGQEAREFGANLRDRLSADPDVSDSDAHVPPAPEDVEPDAKPGTTEPVIAPDDDADMPLARGPGGTDRDIPKRPRQDDDGPVHDDSESLQKGRQPDPAYEEAWEAQERLRQAERAEGHAEADLEAAREQKRAAVAAKDAEAYEQAEHREQLSQAALAERQSARRSASEDFDQANRIWQDDADPGLAPVRAERDHEAATAERTRAEQAVAEAEARRADAASGDDPQALERAERDLADRRSEHDEAAHKEDAARQRVATAEARRDGYVERQTELRETQKDIETLFGKPERPMDPTQAKLAANRRDLEAEVIKDRIDHAEERTVHQAQVGTDENGEPIYAAVAGVKRQDDLGNDVWRKVGDGTPEAEARQEALWDANEAHQKDGFERGGKVVFRDNRGTATHEMVHGNASSGWRAQHQGDTDLNEGITEHYTRKIRAHRGKARDPDFERSGHYDRQAARVAQLERDVGEDTLKDAYFRGKTDKLNSELAKKERAAGHTGSDEQLAKQYMKRLMERKETPTERLLRESGAKE